MVGGRDDCVCPASPASFVGVVVWWLCRVWAPASNGVRILKKLARILLIRGGVGVAGAGGCNLTFGHFLVVPRQGVGEVA